jgi:hypothetical protein
MLGAPRPRPSCLHRTSVLGARHQENHHVAISFPRFAAASLLFVGGAIVALSALGIVVARIVIASGAPVSVSPADVALLDDLVQLMPFVGAFAVATIVAAIGLVGGSSWADRLATAVSAAAVGIGLVGLSLLILGRDPFAAVASDRALDGLGILATFAAFYGLAIVGLALDGKAALRAATPAAA